MTRIEGIKKLFKILFVQCIHWKYNSRAIARLPPLSLPCWRTWRHVFRDWTTQKRGHIRNLSVSTRVERFFVRLVYNFRYQSPNILRTSWNSKMTWHLLVSYAFPRRESRVVKYINDDDAVSTRFTIDRWTDAFQLQWTAFSLPIKCEAEKLTSFENERSGRTR